MYSKVYVEITNICNLNCSFCHGHGREAKMMSKGEFLQVLDKIKGHTEYIYYHLMGEPLLHPELPQFIELARERGFKSIITTNGTFLKKRGVEIVASHPHKVSISLHSFENGDIFAYLTEVAEFAEMASRAGIIVVLRLWNKGCDAGLNDKVLAFLKSNIAGEWAENTKGLRIHSKLHLEWGERFEWPDEKAPVQGEQFFCYGLRDHFGILCDGTVVPCCLDSEGAINLGNIFEGDINEILASSRARAIVNCFDKKCASENLCKKCGYAQRFI